MSIQYTYRFGEELQGIYLGFARAFYGYGFIVSVKTRKL
jgi:hypothetical protein